MKLVTTLGVAVMTLVPTLAFATEGTPLHTKTSQPGSPQSHESGAPVGYKVMAGVGVIGGLGLWLRTKKKGMSTALGVPASRIDVLNRTSLGMRNELVLVDVEGTRLLVGITSSTIQTLAVIQTPADPPVEAPLP